MQRPKNMTVSSNSPVWPLDISISNADVVVSLTNIKFGKDPSVFDFVNEVLNEGKVVGILNGVTINILIVLAKVEGVRGILLIDKEEGSYLGGV